ncbi:MAG: hypothetical protein ACFFCW_08435 [Candidatus Hodarchaeota archaeon]
MVAVEIGLYLWLSSLLRLDGIFTQRLGVKVIIEENKNSFVSDVLTKNGLPIVERTSR